MAKEEINLNTGLLNDDLDGNGGAIKATPTPTYAADKMENSRMTKAAGTRRAKYNFTKSRHSDKPITVPTRVLTGQIETARGVFANVKIEVKENTRKTPEIEELLKLPPRVGFHMSPDDDILLYECLLPLYNEQCVTDPENNNFLINKKTGRPGDIVIGHIDDDGEVFIPWKILADEFYKIKGISSDGKSKSAIAKRDDQTQNFKKMVNALATNPRKRFAAPPRLEKNKYGDTVFVEDFVQPLTIQRIVYNGVKYVVLRLADFFIPQKGEAWTKYKRISPELMNAIRENKNTAIQDALLLLRTLFRSYLGENKKKLKIDKEKTAKVNEKRKAEGKKPAIIVRRDFFLKTLITVTSSSDINARRHQHAHEVFKKAIREMEKSGEVGIYSENNEFSEWWETGNRPEKFKSWSEFYNTAKLTLYILKEN